MSNISTLLCIIFICIIAVVNSATPAPTPSHTPTATPTTSPTPTPTPTPNPNNSTNDTPTPTSSESAPDVYLNVPNLSVDVISLVVEKLNVSLDLNLQVSSLVTLKAGVSATAEKINLTITGVKAQAELIVRLDNVAKIVGDTLHLIETNPQIITGLLSSVDSLLSTVSAVLNTTTLALGQTLQTIVDDTGKIIERTIDSAGNIISQNIVGSINALQIITASNDALGHFVAKVRSDDGSILEITYDHQGGKILSVRVLTDGDCSSDSGDATAPPTAKRSHVGINEPHPYGL